MNNQDNINYVGAINNNDYPQTETVSIDITSGIPLASNPNIRYVGKIVATGLVSGEIIASLKGHPLLTVNKDGDYDSGDVSVYCDSISVFTEDGTVTFTGLKYIGNPIAK